MAIILMLIVLFGEALLSAGAVALALRSFGMRHGWADFLGCCIAAIGLSMLFPSQGQIPLVMSIAAFIALRIGSKRREDAQTRS